MKEEIGRKDSKIGELETNLKRLQEENEQLKQKATKNIGVDTSSLADQKEKSSTTTSSAQTILTSDGGRDFFDEKQNIAGAELKPLLPEKLSDPNSTPVKDPKKSR